MSVLRRVAFALLAVGATLGLLEGVGRLALPDPRTRPAAPDLRGVDVPFDPLAVLVTEAADGTRAFLRDAKTFHPDTWVVPAPAGTFRIGLVGDSTLYGPFGRFFEAGLSIPGKSREVLNFGVRGLASDRVRIVTRTALRQDLDLLVVYVGHNEFLDARLNPRSLTPVEDRFLTSHLVNNGLGRLVQALLPSPAAEETRGPDPREFAAPTAEEQATVHGNYARNVAAICEAARAADVPVAFVAPISSLMYAPELAREADPGNQLGITLRNALVTLDADPAADLDTPLATLRARDPEGPLTRYLEGLVALRAGDREAALASLRAARLLDHHAWRVTEPMAEILRSTADSCGATFVRPEEAFLADPRYLEREDPLFEDQVHPTLPAVRLLADAVVDGLAPLLPPGSTWTDPGDIVTAPGSDQARGWRLPPGRGPAGAPGLPPGGPGAPPMPGAPPTGPGGPPSPPGQR